ncbi:MAG: hypothetical protein QOI41_445 [Myxococcales bacterium]|nr:hypothetical protein [Myxococcales bacterium]
MPRSAGSSRHAADPVSVVEAAYAFDDDDDDAWLARIRCAVTALVPAVHVAASISFVYRAPTATSFALERVSAEGLDGVAAGAALVRDTERDPAYVRDSIFSRTCDFVGNVPRSEQQEGWQSVRAALGIRDGFAVNGLDASGLGVLTLALVKKRPVVTAERRETIAQIAAHVVAGLRIRKRLADAAARLADADAVLSPAGDVSHAAGAARTNESRALLRSAARALDKCRGRLRREDSSRAIAEWSVLVANRWSLLDHFERDGKRYLLACRNAPSAPRGALLTPRERQVVLLATRGHSNKLIGYELGIATSTVGVLLGRAAARLGLTSRRALIAYFAEGETPS